MGLVILTTIVVSNDYIDKIVVKTKNGILT